MTPLVDCYGSGVEGNGRTRPKEAFGVYGVFCVGWVDGRRGSLSDMNANKQTLFWLSRGLIVCLALLFGGVACQEMPTPTPMLEVVQTVTKIVATPTSTLTLIPSQSPRPATSTPTSLPTNTPIPYTTMTPFPTVTPFGAYPVKQIFIQAGGFGGDGGIPEDAYFGDNVPKLVIYTDGQVIVKDFTFLSGQLSTDELCSLLSRLETTGYFEPIDMIYAFDETTEFSDGAGFYRIQVNGPINKTLDIYGPYIDYLVDEIAAAYQLISTYEPPTTLAPFVPEHLLLWIEPLTEMEDPITDVEVASLPDWPTELPPLSELRSDPISPKVVIEGELILPLMKLFSYRMTQQEFREGEIGYRVILRPLLPHENPREFPSYGGEAVAFNLPFTCNNLSLPEVIFTPTPTPPTGTLASEAGELRGRIVFSSDRDGNDEIYVMYADGSNLTRLTNYAGDDTQPAWSPDGQKIAFVSDRSGHDEIYIMTADGVNITRLTYSLTRKQSPAWSPDGSRIVYVDEHNVGSTDWDSEIHLIDVEGNNQDRLTFNGTRVSDFSPTWLDLSRIIYTSGEYPNFSLYWMQDDGSEQSFLTNGKQPSLSPDGERLVYVADDKHIYVALTADLFSNRETSIRLTEGYGPAWSPDGQHIVFVSERRGNAELYVMNVDGSYPIRLTLTTASERSPDWTP
jgi:TolB protein